MLYPSFQQPGTWRAGRAQRGSHGSRQALLTHPVMSGIATGPPKVPGLPDPEWSVRTSSISGVPSGAMASVRVRDQELRPVDYPAAPAMKAATM